MLKNYYELLLLFEKAETLKKSNTFGIEEMIGFCMDSVEKEVYQSSLKTLVLKDAQTAIKTKQPLSFYELVVFDSHQISQQMPIKLNILHRENFFYRSNPKAVPLYIKPTDIPFFLKMFVKRQDEYLVYYQKLIEAKKAVAEARKTGNTKENELTLKQHVTDVLFIFILVLEDLASELKSTSDILRGIQHDISNQSILWVQQMVSGYYKYIKNVPESVELNKVLAPNQFHIFRMEDNNIISLSKETLADKITTMEKVQNKLKPYFTTTKMNKISKAQEYYTNFVIDCDFGLHSLDELFTW